MIRFQDRNVEIDTEKHTPKEIKEIELLNQIQVAIVGAELTEELENKIKSLEKVGDCRYYYQYSYNIDTSPINTVLNNSVPIYIGVGAKSRLLYTKRDFMETELYQELKSAGAIITKKVEYIYRIKTEAAHELDKAKLSLKKFAENRERYITKSLQPIFDRFHGTKTSNHKVNKAIEEKWIYLLIKGEEIIKMGTGIREIEQKDIKKSSIAILANNPDKEINGYKVLKSNEVDIKQKIYINFRLSNSSRARWINILEHFDIESTKYFKEI